MTECTHANSVSSDTERGGVLVEVTACPDCGVELDVRALKKAEVEAAAGREVPPEEQAIQSQAKIDKAEEVGLPGLAAKLREESGEMDALPPATISSPARTPVSSMGDRVELDSFNALVMPCSSCGVVSDDKGACKNKKCDRAGLAVAPKEELVLGEPVDLLGEDGQKVLDGLTYQALEALQYPAPCSKQGGEFTACDTGSGKAHHCTNSKWGRVGTFAGPCRCYTCHELGDALA